MANLSDYLPFEIDPANVNFTGGTIDGVVTGGTTPAAAEFTTAIVGGNEVITTQSPQLGRRNLIINGAMQVAQRGTQVTGATSGSFPTCDRFYMQLQSLGTWTVDQSPDAPNGFANSFKATCTTAAPSPAAGDRFFMYQLIEAKDLQHLAFGTPDAKPLSLSFWVKSNKTGSASIDALQTDNANNMFSTTYTINLADTWEYKTISIPADTAGLIDNDTNAGLQIDFWMNAGSNSTGGGVTSGWESFDNTKRNSSNLGVGGAVSDYFAITGIQLEVGDTATPFEHRSFSEELSQCQRYYYTVYRNGRRGGGIFTRNNNRSQGCLYLPQTMRVAPTFTAVRGYGDNTWTSAVVSAYNGYQLPITTDFVDVEVNVNIDAGSGDGGTWSFTFTFDAEL